MHTTLLRLSTLLALPALTFAQNEGEEGTTDNGAVGEAADAAKGFLEKLMNDPGPTIKDWAMTDGAAIGGKLVLFIVLFIVSKIVAGIVAGIVRKAMSSSKLNLTSLLKDFAYNTARKVVLFLGVLFSLDAVGIPIAPFLAAFGVVGFVVGFALQDTMANFASGVMILMYRPFDVGDVVTAGGETGKVEAMNLVSTTLKTPDNQTKVVPNGSIWGGVITNVTANATRRVDFVFGIGYDDDIPKAEKVLMEILGAHDKIMKDPEPFVRLSELGDSAVNFTVRVWSKTEDYWDVYFDITREVKLRFDAEGLSFPYPQQDVHMHQVA